MNGDAPWERYEIVDTLQQYQRISRTEAKHKASGMPVWIDKLQPYYGDHPDSLGVAKAFLLRHCQVTHPTLPTPIDGWEHEGSLCWVYRRQSGVAIAASLADHRPSLAALGPMITDLAKGLMALHAAGLLHGSLDTESVLIAGKRRVVLTKRGIRNRLNDMLNRSTLEGGVDETPTGTVADDIAAWGELLGALLSGEPHFGRVVVSSRSTGNFDLREAEETLRRKGMTGRLSEVVLRAVQGYSNPGASYSDLGVALEAFTGALAKERVAAGRLA